MSKHINTNTGSLSTVNQLSASDLIARTHAIYEQGWNLPLAEHTQEVTEERRSVKVKATRKVSSR